jgi:pimeloyl-ACP methyl ester carboxylesterase
MARQVFERAGLKLSVARIGSGRPLIFQHGLGGDAGQPAEVFPEQAGWQAVTLECRGHGQSEAGPVEAFAIATFADDLVALIEAEELGPLPLAGISMGAAISLRIAAARPDLVSALILARPAWLDQRRPANMEPNRVVGQLLRDHSPDEARGRFDASPLASTLAAEAPDNLASLRGFFDRRPADGTAELLCRISEDGPGVDRTQIAAIRVPTLVIGNSRDAVHPLRLAQDTAAAIPGARFMEIASKSNDRERYRSDFRAAVAAFLGEIRS